MPRKTGKNPSQLVPSRSLFGPPTPRGWCPLGLVYDAERDRWVRASLRRWWQLWRLETRLAARQTQANGRWFIYNERGKLDRAPRRSP